MTVLTNVFGTETPALHALLLETKMLAPEGYRLFAKIMQFLARSKVPGDFVEVGCERGRTSCFLQEHILRLFPEKTLHVFDSFTGLPPEEPGERYNAPTKGMMSVPLSLFYETFALCKLPLPHIHAGWFRDTLPVSLPSNICFAFLDGDMMSSMRISLQEVIPRLADGGICAIHDYRISPVWDEGVRRACDEYFRQELPMADAMAIFQIRNGAVQPLPKEVITV